MGLKIISKSEPMKVENIVVSILGQPGVGKTSFGLTAEKPLILDFDKGMYRSKLKGDRVSIKSWADVASIGEDDVAKYKTIVIDTAGRFIDRLCEHVVTVDTKNCKKDGTISLAGYGAVKSYAHEWLERIKGFGCDIVFICHAKEVQVGDETKIRVDIAGSTKEEIYKFADLMGYFHVVNKKRRFDIKPTDSSFGKSPDGVESRDIPHPTEAPKALAELIAETKKAINAEVEQGDDEQDAADELRKTFDKMGDDVTAEQVNELKDTLKKEKAPPALQRLLVKLAAKKNIFFDAAKKSFYEDTDE